MKRVSRLFGLLVLGFLAAAPAIAGAPFTVVAAHLQSPRGLTFGPGGLLYVAQAGSGGMSGKITEIIAPWSPYAVTRDLATGLISAGDEGEFIGVSGLSAARDGSVYAMMGLSNAGTPFPHSLLGHLLKVNQRGQLRDLANVGNFDFAWTGAHSSLVPFGDFPDANPYAVLALGEKIYIADAGANTLGLLRPNGSLAIVAFFPNNAFADATPTCIAKGPDGALYVGTLALIDSLISGPSATVYRIDPKATDPDELSSVLSVATPWATGLWPINGCTFGPDGSFYASELITSADFSGGDVVRIRLATPAVHTSVADNALNFPAGVAVGPDGHVYVVNGTAFLPEGQVVRLARH